MRVFGVNGFGRAVVDGVIKRDTMLVQNIVAMLTFLFVVINLVTDLLYRWLDSRIHATRQTPPLVKSAGIPVCDKEIAAVTIAFNASLKTVQRCGHWTRRLIPATISPDEEA